MNLDQVMERISNNLEAAELAIPTGSEDSTRSEIYLAIADRWLHYAHILSEREGNQSRLAMLENQQALIREMQSTSEEEDEPTNAYR